MNPSTPFVFAAQLVRDLCVRPRTVYRCLARYANLRAGTHPVGALPTCSLFDVVPAADRQEVTFANLFEIPLFPAGEPFEAHHTASATLADAYALAVFARTFARERILEVGTSSGESALTFALNSPAGCAVHTLDIQRDNPVIGRKFAHDNADGRIIQHFAPLEQVAPRFAPASFDLIFIDGDHSHAGVRSDSLLARNLVRPGGIVCWHDYTFQFRLDVVRALDELNAEGVFRIRKLLHTNLAVAVA